MATLNDTDFTEIAQIIRRDDDVRDTFKAWNVEKSLWYALFQAAEDWFTNGFNNTPASSFKAALDAVTTTTATQAKWIGKVWFLWRINISW